MIGKNLGLCAAALALPFSVLVPAAASATTAPATTTASDATTVVSDSTTRAATTAKSPKVKVWDYEYNDDHDYFDIEVKYKCEKKGKKKNGTVYGWVYQEHVNTYYWGKAKAKCDGKWRYKWIEADLHHHDYDSVEEGYITVGGGVEDPRKNYKYHEVEKYLSF